MPPEAEVGPWCPAGSHPRAGNMARTSDGVRCEACLLERVHRGAEQREDPLAGFASSPFGRIEGFTA